MSCPEIDRARTQFVDIARAARRFASSDQLVRFAESDVTVYSPVRARLTRVAVGGV